MAASIIFKLAPANAQQRTPELPGTQRPPRRHPRQPPNPGSAPEAHQQGFHLIVPVVGGEQYFIGLELLNERLITRFTRSVFQSLAVFLNIDGHDVQRHAELFTQCFAVTLPLVGIRRQAMMNMHRPHPRTPTRHRMQQHGGIQPTTKRNAVATIFWKCLDGLF